MCMEERDTMKHIVSCEGYEDTLIINWENVFGENMEEQIVIGKLVEKRHNRRHEIIDQQEAGQAFDPGSTAPGIVESLI